MTPPGEMPRWLSRTLTWGSAAAILLAAIHFFPHIFFFPKMVMSLRSPQGGFEAQVLVRPARSSPIIGGYVTLFVGENVDIVVRVARLSSGQVLYEDTIAVSARHESDAENVEIDWKSDGTVRFNYDGRRNVRIYEPPVAPTSK
jgi:membrane-associated protease RseP (regulator of RpoE activity)